MRDYLVIEIDAQDDLSTWRAAEALMEEAGWRKVAERRRFSVFLEGERPPAYRHLPGVAGALIGEAFDGDAARRGQGVDLDMLGFGARADDCAWRLVQRAFGRYVAILNDDQGPVRVLRDPLGAMNAFGWRLGPLRFIGSRLPDLPALWPKTLGVDWSVIGAILRQKNLAGICSPLAGVMLYPPGVLADEHGQGPRLWSPASLARQVAPHAQPEELRDVVDGVVAAFAQRRTNVFCEMSGGLDSAIVATSLAKVGAPLRYGVNHAFPERGDERAYAQDLADKIGAPLVIVERDRLDLTPAKLLEGSGGMRPNYACGDPDHDADLAARQQADGVDAMFTGCGGDGVFYQPATPSLVGDVLKGLAGPRLAGLEALARRNGTTVWSILAKSRTEKNLTAGAGVQRFLSSEVAAPAPDLHPWLSEAQDLPPAKQLQVLMIVNGLGSLGDSRHHAAGDVIDPLMSQPVVEFCLRTPAGRLAVGPINRPFARKAFAERLPASILTRPSKGAVTSFFLRSLADSLDEMRPFLLEGQLAAAGMFDLESLDEVLCREQFISNNSASQIFILLALEAWTRRWSSAQASGLAKTA